MSKLVVDASVAIKWLVAETLAGEALAIPGSDSELVAPDLPIEVWRECFAVEYTLHSTNLDNYAPDQRVHAFDRAKVTAKLDAMARSFEFL